MVECIEPQTLWVQWQGRRIATHPAPFAPGTPVYLCVRPTQILLVCPDRVAERERENLFHGRLVNTTMQAELYTLSVQLDGSMAAADLEILLPGYVYHRLALDQHKDVLIELRRHELRLVPRDT